MQSKIAGPLTVVDYEPDWYESIELPIPYFNNQPLKIVFTDAEYPPYLIEADKALEQFLQLQNTHRVNDTQIVFDYYHQVLTNGYTDELNLTSATDIWKHIHPDEIYIHVDEDSTLYVCVSCECDWDEEHGLQLVFKNGEKLTRASGHDGAYTDENFE